MLYDKSCFYRKTSYYCHKQSNTTQTWGLPQDAKLFNNKNIQ